MADDNIIESAKRAWTAYYPKVIRQAKMEKGARVSCMVATLLDNEDGKLTHNSHVSFMCAVLPYSLLFKEVCLYLLREEMGA